MSPGMPIIDGGRGVSWADSSADLKVRPTSRPSSFRSSLLRAQAGAHTKNVILVRIAADTPAMSNSSPTKRLWLDDVPIIFQERRKGAATRRRVWRGGLRDSDWTDRPPDALRHLQRRRLTGRWLSRLSLW